MRFRNLFLGIIFSLFLIGSVNAVTLNNSNAYYSFDENDIIGSNLIDLSGNGNNGTCNMDANCDTILGFLNNASSFDGLNDEIGLPNIFSSSSSFSISAWVNLQANTTHTVFSAWDGADNRIIMQIDNDVSNDLQFIVKDGTTQSTATWNANFNKSQWYHIVGTYDGTNTKLYLNGDEKVSVIGASGSLSNLIDWEIGQFAEGNYMDGYIDEMAIYNRDLNSSEISTLYNSGNGYNPYSIESLNIVNNNPPNNKTFTYDVENTTLNISTNLNATCNYTYNNVTNSLTTTDNKNHTAFFNMGEANTNISEFNINYACSDIEGKNQTATSSVTFFQDKVPLDLAIFVPQDQQEFNKDINNIEFHIETNYQAVCNYKINNDTSYTAFNLTNGSVHKTNYSTFYPNISDYNTSFQCLGTIVNETVYKNITFYLIEGEVTQLPEIEDTTKGFFGVIESVLAEILIFVLGDITRFIIVIATISLLFGLLSTPFLIIKRIIEQNSKYGKKK